jgi:leucine-zipper of insertion element IS481
MKLHANARTCPNSRKLLVTRIEEEGWSLMPAASAAGISERTAAKWLAQPRSSQSSRAWTSGFEYRPMSPLFSGACSAGSQPAQPGLHERQGCGWPGRPALELDADREKDTEASRADAPSRSPSRQPVAPTRPMIVASGPKATIAEP